MADGGHFLISNIASNFWHNEVGVGYGRFPAAAVHVSQNDLIYHDPHNESLESYYLSVCLGVIRDLDEEVG